MQQPAPKWYWRTSPYREVYIAYYAASILASVPYWTAANYLFPPRKGWSLYKSVNICIMRSFGVLMGRVNLNLGRDLNKEPSNPKHSRITYAPPVSNVSGFVRTCMEQTGVIPIRIPLVWYMRPEETKAFSPRAQPGDKVIVYLGGGGFMASSALEGELTAVALEGLVENTKKWRVVAIDYRVAHNNQPFPSFLLDAISGYAQLLELGYDPKQIVFGGSSAGGIIGHQLIRFLLESQAYPLPAGLYTIGVTWNWTDDGQVTAANIKYDWVTQDLLLPARSLALAGLPSDTVESLYWSPCRTDIGQEEISAVFRGFPPTFVHVGGCEILLAQNIEAKKRLEAAGVSVTFQMEPEAVHDCVVTKWQEPERTRVLKAIIAWADRVTA